LSGYGKQAGLLRGIGQVSWLQRTLIVFDRAMGNTQNPNLGAENPGEEEMSTPNDIFAAAGFPPVKS